MEKEKKRKMSKKTYNILMAICIVVFLIAQYKFISVMIEYKKINDFYNTTTDDFVVESEGGISYVDLDKLIEKNGDVKGWIYIKGADISYPLLQGKDNNYYLYRTYEKEYLGSGSIFLEASNNADFTDSRTIIHGHNMHNGAMFGKLKKFLKEEYREEHPFVYILLPNGVWNKYEIFSAYTANIDDGTFNLFTDTGSQYKDFISVAKSKSVYKNAPTLSGKEKIITLSTCTPNSDDEKRNVVHAKFVGTIENIDEE